jgi:hypothetical protein
MPTVWNYEGDLVSVQNQKFNIYTFLASGFGRTLQQESVFFRRTLWEKAGAYINDEYRFMIDSELWGRFFEHDVLYNVNTCLGGFRTHGANRSQKFLNQCIHEHEGVVENLKSKCSEDQIKYFRKIMFFYKVKHSRITRAFNFEILKKNMAGQTFIDNTQFHVIKYGNNEWYKDFEKFDYL